MKLKVFFLSCCLGATVMLAGYIEENPVVKTLGPLP